MRAFEALLAKFDYKYPERLIAQAPALPRDSAKLLVYDRTTSLTKIDVFKNLTAYIPKRAVLVCNQTKVLPARLQAVKPSGGKVILLYVGHQGSSFTALANRPLHIGDTLTLQSTKYRNVKTKALTITVLKKQDKGYSFKPSFPISKLFSVLHDYGITPIPPYIKHTPLTERKLRNEYQTVFAKTQGSSAAPTASLHFTKNLLNKLQRHGVTLAFVTLHVGLGTFAPLTIEQVRKKQLHSEYYHISSKTAALLNKAKAQGRPIIAVGTTVVRTLESACVNSTLRKLSGNTNLFIREHTKLQFADGIITNFHVPKSSLLMLVAAFVGRIKLLQLYQYAIRKKFRLFSFGDGMYIK